MPIVFNEPLILGKKEVFDPEVFSAIGNPYITEDGIASEFRSRNYYLFKSLTQDNSSYTVKGSFNCRAASSYIQGIFGLVDRRVNTDVVASLRILDTNEIQLIGRKGFALGTGAISEKTSFERYGEDIFFEVEVTPRKMTLFLNGVETYSIVEEFRTVFDIAYIGAGASGWGLAETCSIDLKKFSIRVDGEEIIKGTKMITPKWENKPFRFDSFSINTKLEDTTPVISSMKKEMLMQSEITINDEY